jgi:hypothetical protein
VGAPEELEVQRIAQCWWKLSRVWRYENAQIAVNLCGRHAELIKREILSSEDQAHMVLLKNAASELEATGKISDELNRKMLADAESRDLWEFAKEELNELLARRIGLPPQMMKDAVDANPDTRKQYLLGIIGRAIIQLVRERLLLAGEAAKLTNDLEAISGSYSLDRALRADAAADRALNRALDRLERLQRRRKGEQILPLVSVQLTQ